ncbi:MAG: hypothetical protein K2X97_18110 [Mycobacteriaceae bacterium]|uniref:Lipoprotein LpqB n=2 Tax=Mycobacterium pseudokansasii TaxID=2341080 RepID=A0A498R251_9MYCO|nr:hypothetical protein [Mycobacteriaceae bacterium]VBA29865.1 hypothetical protein LAUMK35_04556 [Mycobacterium pseudokansasii]VBA31352.1 hypothetical protein LAUMK21_04549 [Mycobacterium pseudokansasii]VBA54026.1 hypothetical protein LAUMK142_04452 [Mycobacterium pseudokansasii]
MGAHRRATPTIRRRRSWWAALLAVSALVACTPGTRTNAPATQPAPTATSGTTAPMTMRPGALFYTKAGSLYVSEPAGTPGRKLPDGPADAQPAPSPDLSHVAFVRKATAADYGGELWILDLSPQLAPVGPPRRLVDPAALTHGTGDVPAMVASPRWSPTGKQVALVDNPTGGAVDGGYLLVAAADTGALAPTPLFTRPGSYYGDITVLGSGAVAFTAQPAGRGAADPSKTIQVLDAGSSMPRTTVTDVAVMLSCQDSTRGGSVCNAAQEPVWGAGDFVAYLDTSAGNGLVVTDLDNRSPARVDTGVDTFAWAPAAR